MKAKDDYRAPGREDSGILQKQHRTSAQIPAAAKLGVIFLIYKFVFLDPHSLHSFTLY